MRWMESSIRSWSTEPSRAIGASSASLSCGSGSPRNATVTTGPVSRSMVRSTTVAVLGGPGPVRRGRQVSPTLAQLLHVVGEPRGNLRRLVRSRWQRVHLPQKRVASFGRDAVDHDRSDARLRSGVDLELEQRAIGVVQLGRARPHGCPQVPVFAIELLEHAGDFRRPADRRRRPEAVGHRLPQEPFGQAGGAAKVHALHAVQRDEVVAKRHAPGRVDRLDPHVLKPSEPEEVGDGCAHGGHRQRLADARLDERQRRRVVGRPPLGHQAHLDDRFADVGGLGNRARGGLCAGSRAAPGSARR